MTRILAIVGGIAALVLTALIVRSPDSSGGAVNGSEIGDSASQIHHAVNDGAQLATAPDLSPTGDGFLVVTDSSHEAGQDAAPPVRYSVEVEPGLRPYAAGLQEFADRALLDEKNGWTSHGERRLQQTADPDSANIRVVLATPATVDRHCAANGLLTGGMLSCWDGQRAMLNLTRWIQGAADFESLSRYRTYLINHEFGHGLGRGHEYCSNPGALAPVMMQQTKDTADCRPNGLPYP